MLNVTDDVKIPIFYKNILSFWSDVSTLPPYTASSILSESVWHNNLLRIGNNTISPSLFRSKISSLFVADFFDQSGTILDWNSFKNNHGISDAHYFKWFQILHALPTDWKNVIRIDGGNSRILCDFSPHILVKAKIFPMSKLTSKTFYNILLDNITKPPTSQKSFHTLLGVDNLPWKEIYTLPRKISIDSYSRIFQFKCQHNILFLNNALFRMGLTDTPLCSYCQEVNESLHHLFLDCVISKKLWSDIKIFFSNNIAIPDLTLQSALFGFLGRSNDNFCLNHILLIYKLCLYRFRNKKVPNLQLFIKNLRERELMERQIVQANENKLITHRKKWDFFINLL